MVQLARPIHPFPARMAPEIALAALDDVKENAVVLDPMAGSGTVLRAAADKGHTAIGFDVDPLSVLMARVWTSTIRADRLVSSAKSLVVDALLQRSEVELPWIDGDEETSEFIGYWFADQQEDALRRLAYLLRPKRGPIADALRLALSRLIVRKCKGASLAADVPHSRPHKVRMTNDFRVFDEFVKSAEKLQEILEQEPPPGNTVVRKGDARSLRRMEAESVDIIVSSPPYLNAIDYLRGHRLSLVWLGHQIGQLRGIRSNSIGTERMAAPSSRRRAKKLLGNLPELAYLPVRQLAMVERFALDVSRAVGEARRVTRSGGKIVLVIGNSAVRGVFIENTEIAKSAARSQGLTLLSEYEREIPPSKRYLPPPCSSGPLGTRMRVEAALTFRRD